MRSFPPRETPPDRHRPGVAIRGGLLGADSVTGNGGGNTMYGVWDRDFFFLSVALDDTDRQENEQFDPL